MDCVCPQSRETCDPSWASDTQYLCLRGTDDRVVGMLVSREEWNE
ncbi:MAG: hypothetical protein ACLT3H_08375 [Roseburia sp.]